MIRFARPQSANWRPVFLTLAILAIALKILIPPGFMTGPAANNTAFPLVLCTGHGPMLVHPGDGLPGPDGHDTPPAGVSHDGPCVFAGHALAAPLPSPAPVGLVVFAAYVVQPKAATIGLAPGRTLSGPPLPARGPPTLLI